MLQPLVSLGTFIGKYYIYTVLMNYIYMVIVMVSKARKFQVVKIDVEYEAPVFQVVDTKDNFRRAEARTARGAVLGAIACGINLRDIDFNGFKKAVGYIRL